MKQQEGFNWIDYSSQNWVANLVRPQVKGFFFIFLTQVEIVDSALGTWIHITEEGSGLEARINV